MTLWPDCLPISLKELMNIIWLIMEVEAAQGMYFGIKYMQSCNLQENCSALFHVYLNNYIKNCTCPINPWCNNVLQRNYFQWKFNLSYIAFWLFNPCTDSNYVCIRATRLQTKTWPLNPCYSVLKSSRANSMNRGLSGFVESNLHHFSGFIKKVSIMFALRCKITSINFFVKQIRNISSLFKFNSLLQKL